MGKRLAVFLLVFCAALTWNSAAAEDIWMVRRHQDAPAILADLLLLRPFGIALTVVGTALMVGTSPFIALASIAPPHDAFERAGNALVVAPAAFTVMRPLGELTYQPSGIYPLRP
jgi:hypothetical protein